MTVEWMDPPEARYRTEVNLGWADELISNPGRWARVEVFEDQRQAYQVRTNIMNRLSAMYPDQTFEAKCRRGQADSVSKVQVTGVFVRCLDGEAEDAVEPSAEKEKK
jgi:hypothetical protein